MEIRTPALHSAFGRRFLCLSPPPPPQLLSSYSSSIIWSLLMLAVSSPLQASSSHTLFPSPSQTLLTSSFQRSHSCPIPLPNPIPLLCPWPYHLPVTLVVSVPLFLIPPQWWFPRLFSLHSCWLFAELLFQIQSFLCPHFFMQSPYRGSCL